MCGWYVSLYTKTNHTSNVTRHTSHVTRHTSHVTRHTSHVTRHTSHVTRHTSHLTHFSAFTHRTCAVVAAAHGAMRMMCLHAAAMSCAHTALIFTGRCKQSSCGNSRCVGRETFETHICALVALTIAVATNSNAPPQSSPPLHLCCCCQSRSFWSCCLM